MGFYKREHGDWSRNSFRMNTVFILVFVILASSHASPAPDPDTHIHVHLDAEDSKGGKSPKTGGGVLASNSSGDYGHWPPKPPHCGCGVCPCPPPPIKCHSHCMPHCLPTCKPPTCGCSTCPCPRPKWNRRLETNTKAADYSGDAGDYGHWRPKICHSHCMPHCLPTCRPPCSCPTCPCPGHTWNRRKEIGGDGEDYLQPGNWPPKPPCGCHTCPCPAPKWHGRK